MLGNIQAATTALKKRGVPVGEDLTAAWGVANPMRTFKMTTPNGVLVTLWGFIAARPTRASRAAKSR